MNSLRLFLLLFGIMLSISNAPLNGSFEYNILAGVADALLNASSNHFPGSSFLNYVLYGSENATYSYKDFLDSYGSKVPDLQKGAICIGSDGKLGGIVDENFSVVLPIPQGRVQAVPKANLKSYFPKGYIIKFQTYPGYRGLAYGNIYSYLNKKVFCNNCSVSVDVSASSSNLDYGNIFQLFQFGTTFIHMYGYFDQYDNKTKNGTLTVRFVQTNIRDRYVYSYYYVDPNVDNSVSYSLDPKEGFTYKGLLPIIYNNYTLQYSFYGNMIFDTKSNIE